MAAPAFAAYRKIDCETDLAEGSSYSPETPVAGFSGRNGTKTGTVAAVRKATPSPRHEPPPRNSFDSAAR